jgi:PAS domain S-box-containing protein
MSDQASETRQRLVDRLAAGARSLLAVWERLTRPAAAIQQRDLQRQARLLSALLLVVIVVGLLLVLAWELWIAPVDPFRRGDFFLEVGALALLTVIYRVSRTRRYTLAAVLTIGVVTGAIFAVAASTHDPERVNLLAYLLVPVVACTLFLSLQVAALLIALDLAGMLLFSALSGGEGFWNPWVGFTILTSIAILLTTYYHALLEEDRRAALRESEEKFRLIFENAFDGISIHEDILPDESHRIRRLLDCNARYAEMAGRSKEELLRANDTLAIQRSAGPVRSIEQEISMLREERPHEGFFSWVRPDGRENVIEYRAQPIRLGNKTLTIVLDRDITERMRTENALRESEERYRLLVESADAAISSVNWEGTFLFMNGMAARSLGGEPQDFVGQTVFDLFPLPAADMHVSDIRRVIESGQGTVVEAPTVVAGETRWYRTSLQPIRDATGTVTAALVIAYDITERKNAESALLQSEAKTRALLNAIPDLMFQFNREGVFIDYKSADMGLVVPPDQFLGRKITEVLPDLGDRVMRVIEQALQTGETQVLQYQLPLGGAMRDYEARMVASGDNEVVAIVRDITERARAEAALRESEEKFRSIVEQSHDGITLTDRTGILIEWNRAIEEITGVAREEALGRYLWDVQFSARPENERTPELYEQIKLVGTRLFEADQLPAPSQTYEHEIQCLDGTHKIVQTVSFRINNEDSFMMCGILRDITSRKQAEEQRLKLGVEQEKVKLLSDFVRDVSHEFRTPLSVMYTGLEILERAATLDDASARRMEHIKVQAMYISDLVDAMLMMAHLDSDPQFAFAPIDLSVMARDVSIEMQALLQKKNQTLTLDLAEGLPVVRADVGKLRHALVNLCKNAVQFTPGMGSITLRTYVRGEHAVIEVVDTGIGLDEHDLPHIFERFYRADQARTERHAGLGLPIAQKIVEVHRGRIEVESAPGQGSTFRIVLPVVGE